MAAAGRGLHPARQNRQTIRRGRLLIAARTVLPKTKRASAASVFALRPFVAAFKVAAAELGLLVGSLLLAVALSIRAVIVVGFVVEGSVPRGHRLEKDAARDEELAGIGRRTKTFLAPPETASPEAHGVLSAQSEARFSPLPDAVLPPRSARAPI